MAQVTHARTRREYAPPQKTAPVSPRVLNALLKALTPEKVAQLREAVEGESFASQLREKVG